MQRTRNSRLLIHGVDENDSNNTDVQGLFVINNLMGLPGIKIVDIQRTHRLGPPIKRRNSRSANVRPRPIIMKTNGFQRRTSPLPKTKRNFVTPFTKPTL